jgi:hypothetical protein
MSNAERTTAPMLRNPAANPRMTAHVKSSLVGRTPPRIHVRRMSTAVIPEVTIRS